MTALIGIVSGFLVADQSLTVSYNQSFEKYNVEDGSLNVSNEYEMPAMMGWSAGVYLAAENYLNNKQ